MKNRSKLIASVTISLGLLVLLTAGYAFRDKALEQYWLWKLESEDDGDRKVAAEKLGAMGSIEAIPGLIEIFRREHEETGVIELAPGSSGLRVIRKTPHYSTQALIKIGQSAVPALVELLKDDELLVRENAAFWLGEFAPSGKDVIAALVETFKDENEYVRSAAGSALAKIGRPAVPALIKALKDERTYVRKAAPIYLAEIGPYAKTAVPALIETLGDENKVVRINAVHALGRIGPGDKVIVQALIDALKDRNKSVRYFAARTLGGMGPIASDAVPALNDSLTDENESVRKAATKALKKIQESE